MSVIVRVDLLEIDEDHGFYAGLAIKRSIRVIPVDEAGYAKEKLRTLLSQQAHYCLGRNKWRFWRIMHLPLTRHIEFDPNLLKLAKNAHEATLKIQLATLPHWMKICDFYKEKNLRRLLQERKERRRQRKQFYEELNTKAKTTKQPMGFAVP